MVNKYRDEIIKTEKDFADLVLKEGIGKAFLAFAADDAVINRAGKIHKGKKEILEYFDSQQFTNVKLEWKPDFVDVSSSGDMAYTFGKYTFSATSEKGEPIEAKGIFHTVWKRQSDNNWKYVWD